MNRDDLLRIIELRIEMLFGDDMIFEEFLNIEQIYDDNQLELLSNFSDERFIKYIDTEIMLNF